MDIVLAAAAAAIGLEIWFLDMEHDVKFSSRGY